MARPFIKWAGGKTYLLPTLSEIIPQQSDLTWFEPMVGGGALFFAFADRFRHKIISDSNPDLINLYRVVQSQVEDLISELYSGDYWFLHKTEPRTLETYQRIRSSDPDDPVLRAARILYLLKTCFNGLMRTNKSGRFNTSPGSYFDPVVCDTEALRGASAALRGAEIRGPLDVLDVDVPPDAYVVLDPPYHSVGNTRFTDYSGDFSEEKQRELISRVLSWGRPFVYMNRSTELVRGGFAGAMVNMVERPLTHSIQPVYTQGQIETELIVYG